MVVVVKWGAGGVQFVLHSCISFLFESHVPDDHLKIRLGPSKQLWS